MGRGRRRPLPPIEAEFASQGRVPHMVQEQAVDARGAPAAPGPGPLQLSARRRPHAAAARAQRLDDVGAVEGDEGGVEALERRRAHELAGPRGRPALGGSGLLPVRRSGGSYTQATVVLGALDTSVAEEDRVLIAPPCAAAPRARVLESERAVAQGAAGIGGATLAFVVAVPQGVRVVRGVAVQAQLRADRLDLGSGVAARQGCRHWCSGQLLAPAAVGDGRGPVDEGKAGC
mmetsp:Transcript_152523/g.487382  ORF Transcript_152523/g.487382 Transcript_152523/m.487382 type:complete len:232 (-) Transcript_152523:132-827(-)